MVMLSFGVVVCQVVIKSSALGGGRIVNTIVSCIGSVQGATAFASSISSTDPLAISVTPGVYTGVRIIASLKTPSPEVVQSAPVQ